MEYILTIDQDLDCEIDSIAAELKINKSEVLRRALTLYFHAYKADEVELITKSKKESITKIIIK